MDDFGRRNGVCQGVSIWKIKISVSSDLRVRVGVVVVHRQTLVGIFRCSVDFSEQKLNIRSRSS
jgi:hypothetical protein